MNRPKTILRTTIALICLLLTNLITLGTYTIRKVEKYNSMRTKIVAFNPIMVELSANNEKRYQSKLFEYVNSFDCRLSGSKLDWGPSNSPYFQYFVNTASKKTKSLSVSLGKLLCFLQN